MSPPTKRKQNGGPQIYFTNVIPGAEAAKYLNDSSPKNKHWAKYSRMQLGGFSFGFSQAEVNLMERQLLHLLECDLRITEEDLYCELDSFWAPLRFYVAVDHERRVCRRAAQQAAIAANDSGS
ncbi:hypothetical protein LA080_008066 [Diaporthe eres]|nr:hypothetical protein LA080_008066 [Diaporthe eres]